MVAPLRNFDVSALADVDVATRLQLFARTRRDVFRSAVISVAEMYPGRWLCRPAVPSWPRCRGAALCKRLADGAVRALHSPPAAALTALQDVHQSTAQWLGNEASSLDPSTLSDATASRFDNVREVRPR
jgi:hypothetical protein